MRPEDYADTVKALAWRCWRKLPNNSKYGIEDLEQEGWVIFSKLRRRRLRHDGASFSTLLKISIVRRYSSLLRDEYKNKRSKNVSLPPDVIEGMAVAPGPSPDSYLEAKELLRELSKICPELADVILNGIPDELLREARRRNRSLALKRGWSATNMRLIFGEKEMEKFFGISIKAVLEKLQTTGV